MNYRILRTGRYRFGENVVEVTPETLVGMAAHSHVPMKLLLRHNVENVVGVVTRLFVTDDGAELWATVMDLKLVPAFSVDPPQIHEVSVTGAPGWDAVREEG